MGRLRSFRKSSALAVLFPLTLVAVEVPTGTELEVRLKTKVSTQSSKAKDPVEAVVIAPVMVDGQFVIPSGAVVRGAVEKVTQAAKADERSVLALTFNEMEIDGAKVKPALH